MRLVSTGKIRDTYDVGDNLVLVTSDRISAFDQVLPSTVDHKGSVLNRLSAFWFDSTADIVPNHMISIMNEDMPSEFQADEFLDRCMMVKKLKMLPVVCYVRGYITGSGWTSYKENGTMFGITLPKDMVESQKLYSPLYTPTSRPYAGFYKHLDFMQVYHLVGRDLALQLIDRSFEIYSRCSEYALSRGIIIADAKFEFGIDQNGTLTLADELLTPESSMFWQTDKYEIGHSQESYDKQCIQDWLGNCGWDKTSPIPEIPDDVLTATSNRYIQTYNTLTGLKF